MDIDGWDDEAGKRAWLEDPMWQRVGECIETIMGASDYLEQYFAINLVFEPLVGELFRSGFLMQAASANSDFMTPSVIAAAESDYERNLANTIERNAMVARTYPNRFIVNGSFDPRDGEKALEYIHWMKETHDITGVKMYTAEWNGASKGWKLNDPDAYK